MRTKYMHDYYVRNKHRKKYTYVKKGVMKRLNEPQYKIIAKMRQGFKLHMYADIYQFFENGLYHLVNTRSVECLIASKHLEIVGYEVKLTEKGINHRQSTKK